MNDRAGVLENGTAPDLMVEDLGRLAEHPVPAAPLSG